MSGHHCETLIVHCIDFRFQQFIDEWIGKRLPPKSYDRVGLGGGIYDFYSILKQVEISTSLHHISKVIFINHEDCGAYGAAGTYERHIHDLTESERKIEALYPRLDVETYYLHLDGTFEEISKTQ